MLIIKSVINKALTKLKILKGYAMLNTNIPNRNNPITLRYEMLNGILQSLSMYKFNKQADMAK